jgi:hypothetical protein
VQVRADGTNQQCGAPYCVMCRQDLPADHAAPQAHTCSVCGADPGHHKGTAYGVPLDTEIAPAALPPAKVARSSPPPSQQQAGSGRDTPKRNRPPDPPSLRQRSKDMERASKSPRGEVRADTRIDIPTAERSGNVVGGGTEGHPPPAPHTPTSL